jgi:hypothetical protein
LSIDEENLFLANSATNAPKIPDKVNYYDERSREEDLPLLVPIGEVLTQDCTGVSYLEHSADYCESDAVKEKEAVLLVTRVLPIKC